MIQETKMVDKLDEMAFNSLESDTLNTFDPEGSGYDFETANRLGDRWPLLIAKPTRRGKYQHEEVEQWAAESFYSWVWHEDLSEWKKHGGSFDPTTGMLLKGMKYKTIDKTIAAEKERGY